MLNLGANEKNESGNAFWGAHAPRVLCEGALPLRELRCYVLIRYETSDSETRQRTRRGCLPSALARKRKTTARIHQIGKTRQTHPEKAQAQRVDVSCGRIERGCWLTTGDSGACTKIRLNIPACSIVFLCEKRKQETN